MITRSLSIRGLLSWILVVSALLPAFAEVERAAGQELVSEFPSGVDVLASLETPIIAPSSSGLSLWLSQQTLDPGRVVDDTALADPLLVFVDSGTLTVATRRGIETVYRSGSQFVLQPSERSSLRNDAADPVSLTLLGLAQTPDAGATGESQPFFADSAPIFTTKVSTGLFPARLLLARLSWEPGVDAGLRTSPGPVGFMTESGALTIAGESGEERRLRPGRHIVFRAGTVHRERNAGQDPAIALVAALVPDGLPLFESAAPGPTAKMPGCDEGSATNPLAIRENGDELPYQVWVAWSPTLVFGKNCDVYAFFSAEARFPDGTLGSKKLYTARFDPESETWRAATSLPGGEIQFGASAAVDERGTVHLVYSDRADDRETSFSQLVYVTSTDSGGWAEPVAVTPHEDAGHQLSPELLIDANGVVHVVWQDQRSVKPAARIAAASNADVFASELGSDGVWSDPIRLSTRPNATTNTSRPQLATDGDRLVVVWSVYTAASGLDTADRLEWSTRPIDGSADWSVPQTLLERGDAQIGGRLLDLASDRNGGVALVYGSRANETNSIFVQRLQASAADWDIPIEIASGDLGSFPSAAFASDGTLVVVYNHGSGANVDVGMITVPAGATERDLETVLTSAESGSMGRAFVEIDGDDEAWVIYMHEPIGGVADSVWVKRNVSLQHSE